MCHATEIKRWIKLWACSLPPFLELNYRLDLGLPKPDSLWIFSEHETLKISKGDVLAPLATQQKLEVQSTLCVQDFMVFKSDRFLILFFVKILSLFIGMERCLQYILLVNISRDIT